MKVRSAFLVTLLAMCVPGLVGCPATTRAARQLQLDSFDQAWQRVGETFPDPDMNGVDWDAAREEFRPQAEQATTAVELRPILREMFALLDTSHLGVVSGDFQATMAEAAAAAKESADEDDSGEDESAGTSEDGEDEEPDGPGYGDVGMQLRLVGDQVLVTQLDPRGPAAAAGVQLGWMVTRIGKLDVATAVERVSDHLPDVREREVRISMLATGSLSGKVGREFSVAFLDREDEVVELSLGRRPPPREPNGHGHMTPQVVHDRSTLLDEGQVGYLWFDVFLMPAPQIFTEAIVGFLEADVSGVIIDLRGNPGGIVGMIRGMAGHLLADKLSLGTMMYRDERVGEVRLELRSAPRLSTQRFTGPVAILVDRTSASTSEVFASGLQGVGRARVFGVRTAGMAMPSVFEKLPNGDAIQLPMADSTTPTGARLEKDGVIPDEEITLSREAFAGGRDPVLDAALTWLAAQRPPEPDPDEQTVGADTPPTEEDEP